MPAPDLRKQFPRSPGEVLSGFVILACVEGAAGILLPDGKEERLNPGEFALLPAALGFYTLAPQAENTSVLKAFVPSTG